MASDRSAGPPASCGPAREGDPAVCAAADLLCPICLRPIPPEHLGRKVWCRSCGYLESCCNPE